MKCAINCGKTELMIILKLWIECTNTVLKPLTTCHIFLWNRFRKLPHTTTTQLQINIKLKTTQHIVNFKHVAQFNSYKKSPLNSFKITSSFFSTGRCSWRQPPGRSSLKLCTVASNSRCHWQWRCRVIQRS